MIQKLLVLEDGREVAAYRAADVEPLLDRLLAKAAAFDWLEGRIRKAASSGVLLTFDGIFRAYSCDDREDGVRFALMGDGYGLLEAVRDATRREGGE